MQVIDNIMKAEIRLGPESEYNEESNFLDILHSTSKFYFEQGVVDEYDGDIVYHNAILKNEEDTQIEGFGFLKSGPEFMKNHENDWFLILNDLRNKYTQREKLWNKLGGEKYKELAGSMLFILMVVVDVRKKIYFDLCKYLKNELEIQFEDYGDNRIKISENLTIINRGEPWIKVIDRNNILDIPKIENFHARYLEEVETDLLKYESSFGEKENAKLYFKKLYPYETSRNDVAYVIMYGNQKNDTPLTGIIYSILED